MKGLIIKKEWLDKIFDEGKVWEMRTRNTSIRGQVGLIESGSGLVMGTANIIHSSFVPDYMRGKFIYKHKVEDLSLLDKWSHAWVLTCSKRLAEPVPYNHPKGAVIWVNLPDDLNFYFNN